MRGKRNAEQNTIDYIKLIYFHVRKRYGLQNMADQKFTQLIYGLYAYQDSCPRIKLFTRFAGLLSPEINEAMGLVDQIRKDPKEQDEQQTVSFSQPLYVFGGYSKFIDQLYKIIVNFKIEENEIAIYVSQAKAQEIFKVYYKNKFSSDAEFNERSKAIFSKISFVLTKGEAKQHKWLSKLVGTTFSGPNNAKKEGVWVVDIDEFYSQCLTESQRIIKRNQKTVDDIFRFADVSGDGNMDFEEFEQIMRIFAEHSSKHDVGRQRIEAMFNEYASPVNTGV